jgi:hypothetical protein
MTVIVEHAKAWVTDQATKLHSHVRWLEQHVGPTRNHHIATWREFQDEEQNAKAQEHWQQLCDNYWCLLEREEDPNMAICSLTMYHGTGWHVMHMRGIPRLYTYDDFLVTVVYDEIKAVQFKLSC